MKDVLIFDNDPAEAASIERMVSSICKSPELLIFCVFSRSEISEYLLNNGYPDVMIVDASRPSEHEGPSGIEIVKELIPGSSDTQVIFTSEALNDALEVYAVPHVYFLKKPITDTALLTDALRISAENLRNHPSRVYQLKSKNKLNTIKTSSIIYVESDVRKVKFHTFAGVLEEYAKLDDVQEKLPESFVRIHKSYLVNPEHVVRADTNSVTLVNEIKLNISKSRRPHACAVLSSKVLQQRKPQIIAPPPSNALLAR